jgi:hypothetical protein
MADWGVLVSQPQRHRLVADGLTARSVEYFMPMMEVRSRRRKELYPLFGRYVLVVVSQGWEALQYLRGVAGIMLEPEPRHMVDGEYHGEPGSTERLVPALICESELIRVMGQCVDGVWQDPSKTATPQKDFVYGQAVTPTSGPFTNHVGVFDSKTRKGGDAAFFKLFGVERRMIFKAGELTAA